MIMKKYIFAVCLLLVISLLLQNCGKKKSSSDKEPLIRIGDFKVSLDEFNSSLHSLDFGQGVRKEEKCKQLLDKYVNIGLLIEIARQKGYSEKEAFIKQLEYYKKGLYVKYIKKENKVHLKLIKMGYTLDNVDSILNNSLKLNSDLLSKIDFAISPLKEDKNPIVDNRTIVELRNKKITISQLKREINRLPQNIQGLFRNKLTRTKAIAALAILKCDTVSYLTQWINNELLKRPFAHVYNLLSTGKDSPDADNTECPDQMVFYPWLAPELLSGYSDLKFDFRAIEDIELPYNSPPDKAILANCGSWKLTVKDFNDALDKLTRVSRFEIAKDENAVKTIEYLAANGGEILNKSQVKINKELLSRLDLIGNIPIMGSIVREDDIVISLGDLALTVSNLRSLVSSLPEGEKARFTKNSSKENSVKDLIISEFWLKLFKVDEIIKESSYQNDLRKTENLLLANMLFKSEIFCEKADIFNEHWDYNLKKCEVKLNEKLKNYICQNQTNSHVVLNKSLLQRMSIDTLCLTYKAIVTNKNCPKAETINAIEDHSEFHELSPKIKTMPSDNKSNRPTVRYYPYEHPKIQNTDIDPQYGSYKYYFTVNPGSTQANLISWIRSNAQWQILYDKDYGTFFQPVNPSGHGDVLTVNIMKDFNDFFYYIEFDIPPLKPGKYDIWLGANSGAEELAQLQMFWNGKKYGLARDFSTLWGWKGSYPNNKSKGSYFFSTLGVAPEAYPCVRFGDGSDPVVITPGKKNVLRIESVSFGYMLIDYIEFEPK